MQNRDIFAAIVVLILKIQRLKYKRIVFMWNIFDLRHKIRIYLWPIIIFMLLVMDNRRHCGHKKENNFDAKRMISPLEKDCESHFRYQQDGTIQPAEKTDEAAEYTITKLNLNDKRLCRARENALWTFNVFQLNGEEKQRELKKFECSEELPPYWDAIKYFLTQGD